MGRRTNLRTCTIAFLASLALGALAGGACSDDLPSDQTSSTTSSSSGGGGGTTTTTTTATTASSGGTGGTMGTGGAGTGGTGGTPDCYTNPMTHLEIINACTDAQKIDVMPVLPLLQPDGGVPPLP